MTDTLYQFPTRINEFRVESCPSRMGLPVFTACVNNVLHFLANMDVTYMDSV